MASRATNATISSPPSLALKTLILPGGLGSTHEVMVFGKDVWTPRLRRLSGASRLAWPRTWGGTLALKEGGLGGPLLRDKP